MRRVYRPTLAGRITLGSFGVALVLMGLFFVAVASFADGSTRERVFTIAIALLIAGLADLQLVLLRARSVADDRGVEVVTWVSRAARGAMRPWSRRLRHGSRHVPNGRSADDPCPLAETIVRLARRT